MIIVRGKIPDRYLTMMIFNKSLVSGEKISNSV